MTTIVFEPLCDNHSAYPTKPRPQLGMGYCLDDHYVKTIVWLTFCDIHWVKSEFFNWWRPERLPHQTPPAEEWTLWTISNLCFEVWSSATTYNTS
jgi:hypothetical protein